jgi:hypothetical protein
MIVVGALPTSKQGIAMSIVGTWVVGWTLNVYPSPIPSSQRKNVLTKGDEVTFNDMGGSNVEISFKSYVSSGGETITGNIAYEDAATKDSVMGEITNDNNDTYLISAAARTVDGKAYICGWISFGPGSQDSGGQWGGPPK